MRRKYTKEEIRDALASTSGRCGICGDDMDIDDFGAAWLGSERGSIDHVVPLAEGGDDSPGNRQPAHLGCNQRKGVKSAALARSEHGIAPWGPLSPMGRVAAVGGATAGAYAIGGSVFAHEIVVQDASGKITKKRVFNKEAAAGVGVLAFILAVLNT